MTKSWTALAVVGLFAASALAGCGSSSEVSAATTACRVYAITSGVSPRALATYALDYVANTPDPGIDLEAQLIAAKAAATRAALVIDLPDPDYKAFKAVLDTATPFIAKFGQASNGDTPGPTDAEPLASALTTLSHRCV
jgi:hypothetical protein